MAFMPENAPLVVLSFLGTCFLVGVGLVCLEKIFFQLNRVDAPSTVLLQPPPHPCGCGSGPESIASAAGF
jgi:hypothetical protein